MGSNGINVTRAIFLKSEDFSKLDKYLPLHLHRAAGIKHCEHIKRTCLFLPNDFKRYSEISIFKPFIRGKIKLFSAALFHIKVYTY